jgi:nitric oxide reductase activation protein
MEDREDASEAMENTGLPSNERDTRESPADSAETTPKDDESVATESKENREDFLSTVKEEPSKEAEEMAVEDATSHLGSVVHQKCTPSMDEDLTMDASATTHSGYHTPANSSNFCGCFAL